MVYIPVIVVALVASAANADPINPLFPSGRIVGGKNALVETHPYQVSLEYAGRHNCGGSIISKNYIVTAGHCVGSNVQSYTIRAGTSFKGKSGSVHQAEKVIRHEKYGTNSYGVPTNDVAVIKVKEAFKFDETRQPIQLFKAKEESPAGAKTIITGWGETGKGSPSQLQSVVVPIVTKQLCNESYKRYGGLPEGQICAAYFGEGGKDACQGDSGGPLTIAGRLAGIVSWGNGCAQAYYPGVYTEVAHYRNWIEQNADL